MLQLLVRDLFHLKGLVQYCILVRESRSISHSLRLSLNNPAVKFKRKTIHELLKLDNFSHSINIVISLFTIHPRFKWEGQPKCKVRVRLSISLRQCAKALPVKLRYSIKSQKQCLLKYFKIHTFFDTQLSEDFQSFSSELSVDKLSPSILRKLMNQHALLKRNQIHIHLTILKSRHELYRGRETKTVSPNGIRSRNTTFNPQLTFRVLSHLFTLISRNLLALQCCLSL